MSCRVENCQKSAERDHEEFCAGHYGEYVADLRAAVTHHPGTGNGPNILVVDDDKDNRSIFVRLLRKIGQFDIRDTGAADGEAVRRIDQACGGPR